MALFFESSVAPNRAPRRFGRGQMFLNRPKLIRRIPVEWLLRIQRFCEFGLRVYGWGLSRGKKRQKRYLDDVEGFTFFMDGNARAKRLGKRFFFKMQTIQQTFVVPSEDRPDQDSKKALLSWLRETHKEFRDRGLRPTMWDVLWLPKDEGFLLSASTDTAGYAVSCAFETSNGEELEGSGTPSVSCRACFTTNSAVASTW